MDKSDKIFKAFTITIAIILITTGILGVAVAGSWIYISKNSDKYITPTASVTYTGGVLEPDGTERSFIEVNYFANVNKQGGVEAFELCFNSYSGWDRKSIIGHGVQYINNTNKPGLESIEKWDYYQYDRQNTISWAAVNALDFGDPMYIIIDNTIYRIAMEGTYKTYYETPNVWRTMKSVFKGDFRIKKDTHEVINKYTMQDFYESIASKIVLSSVGVGSFTVGLVDLAEWFTVQRMEEDGTFSDVTNTTYQSSFFECTVNVYNDGLIRSSESAFKMIENRANYSTVGLSTESTTYAEGNNITYITATNCSFIVDNLYKAYVPVIKESALTSLIENDISSIVLYIDFEDVYMDALESGYKNLLVAKNYLFREHDSEAIAVERIIINFKGSVSMLRGTLYTDINTSYSTNSSVIKVSEVEK